MVPEGLIDDRNHALWQDLKDSYSISVLLQKRDEYGCRSFDNTSLIYVPDDNLDPASFAHELLHVLLKKKGIGVGSSFSLAVRDNELLGKVISEELRDHIGNCLDHLKMFPLFVEMGYPREDFISDYSKDKLSEEELTALANMLFLPGRSEKVYVSIVIDFYIAKFFAVKACINNSFDYDSKLEKLRQVEPDLYQILDDFWNAWINYDFDKTDFAVANYQLLVYDFTRNLEVWMSGIKIVFPRN